MPIISASSIMVMVLMGKLNTSPRQAHLILRLLSTLCNTPVMLNVITTRVTTLVMTGLKPVKNAIPKVNSTKGYK